MAGRTQDISALLRLGGPEMEEITIRDGNLKILRIIDSAEQLARAQELWNSLVQADGLPSPDWTHRIDIKSGCHAGRWLYNQEGVIARLNKGLKPSYRVPNVESFNAFFLDDLNPAPASRN